MMCLLDVIAWPFFLIGGSVMFLIVAGILLCISAVVLMLVTWNRHRKKTNETETTTQTDEMEES